MLTVSLVFPGINLLILYGERENAFLRPQEEIIQASVDHSIFAWVGMGDRYGVLLARTPEDFAGRVNMRIVRPRKGHSVYRLTNRGVKITLSLTPWTLDTYLAWIHCNDPASLPNSVSVEDNVSGISLKRLDEGNQYAQVSMEEEELNNNVKPALGWESPGRHAYSVMFPSMCDSPRRQRQNWWQCRHSVIGYAVHSLDATREMSHCSRYLGLQD